MRPYAPRALHRSLFLGGEVGAADPGENEITRFGRELLVQKLLGETIKTYQRVLIFSSLLSLQIHAGSHFGELPDFSPLDPRGSVLAASQLVED